MILSERLVAIRCRYHTMKHPWWDLWCSGTLTLKQAGMYMIQHRLWVSEVYGQFGLCYATAPRRIREAFVRNLAEELGLFNPRGGQAQPHDEMVYAWCEHCGYSREEILSTGPFPGTAALGYYGWKVACCSPWACWFGFLASLESQQPGMQSRLVPALHEHYGFAPGDSAIAFFEQHYEADLEHGSQSLLLLDDLTPDDVVDQVVACAEIGARLRWEYTTNVYRRMIDGEISFAPDDYTTPEPFATAV